MATEKHMVHHPVKEAKKYSGEKNRSIICFNKKASKNDHLLSVISPTRIAHRSCQISNSLRISFQEFSIAPAVFNGNII
jgi:hypothetical protein